MEIVEQIEQLVARSEAMPKALASLIEHLAKLATAGSVAQHPTSKDLLTTEKVAKRLGVSPRTLEAMRLRGQGKSAVQLPYKKIGRRVLYASADVDAYVTARSFTSTAEARRAGVI